MTSVSMTTEQLQQMVLTITSVTVEAIQTAGTTSSASFANANFILDGARNPDKVEEFLTTASIYKKVQKISDQVAFQTLPLVLKGEASTWWLGIKDSIDTWVEFEKRLRRAFAPKKPGYLVF
ncbi:activity-regulated cytoskeleton associated protein 1-like [Hyposmocoma kahamanoa]|uniref:activity-regulated cytoskeleton associated protein 1-like n=1 Tax=Hyposmocoma kahamanoa TaxID=1477025 RepID=UPI000E6D742D|nr:activity-regulated cytoskeleton associated protein 1-like [Hyposmocoma kahamanoa]